MKQFLIVDDSAFMRRLIRKSLTLGNHRVIGEAANGIEAISQCQLLQPDFVTLDLTMPEIGGLDALKLIKSRCPEVNVIVVSAMGQKQLITEAITMGASGFVIKPFCTEKLLDEINTIINRS